MLTGPQRALFEALRFTDRNASGLAGLTGRDWDRLAAFCDRTQLTLPLLDACPEALPEPIRARFEEAARKTARRAGHIRDAFSQIANRLEAEGLEFAVLKGFANAPAFFPDARRRVQYDLDLYLPGEGARGAAAVLQSLGYEPLRAMEDFPTDHLPVMIRKTGWQWSGDFFDPEIPVSVDVHFRLWDRETEGFEAPGWKAFWDRRVRREWEGAGYASFREEDLLGYHCLHLLRHLLRGSLRLSHVYELAYFLNNHADAEAFWSRWQELHDDGLCRLEALTFELARKWFACAVAPPAAQEVANLPLEVHDWVERYGWSPVEAIDRPNKHELWLHLSLLDGSGVQLRVLRRRLLPARLPGPVDAVHLPAEQLTAWVRWRARYRYAAHLAQRAAHHVAVLPGVAWHGAGWAWRASAVGRLGSGYWRFLGASTCFNLGAFVFFVLYNLYLLDVGYEEDTLGLVASAMTVGSIVATLPAGRWLQYIGLRWGLASCFLLIAAASLGRVLFTAEPALLGFAFLSGAAFALFAVAVAPSIAALTDERIRPRAFSIFFAVGISLGIVGGLLGGQLPRWLGSTRAALIAGAVLMAAAAVPALALRIPSNVSTGARTFPRGPFIRRFVLVIAIWTAAIGAFSPFFNAFFARQFEATVEQIGTAYSIGQAGQVLAILAAPYVLRWLGLSRGVAVTQIASGAALAVLIAIPASAGFGLGAAAYAGYMGLHYMGEPGLYSLLMKRVAAGERSGASALHSLAMFSAQAISAAVAGMAIARGGYTPVVLGAALLAMLAGAALWRLIPDQVRD